MIACLLIHVARHTHFGLFDNICKFSNPDKAMMGCDQKEAVTTVQGRSSRLNQSGLNMPSTWLKCTEKLGHYQCESHAEPHDVRRKHTKWFALTVLLNLGWILNSRHLMLWYNTLQWNVIVYFYKMCTENSKNQHKLPFKQNITTVGHNMLLLLLNCQSGFFLSVFIKDRMLFWEHAHRFRLRGMPYEELVSKGQLSP